MILLLATGFSDATLRVEPESTSMRQLLTERAAELVGEQFPGREIRLELEARWIPRQLLRLPPTVIERMELASPPDRVATLDVVTKQREGRRHSFQVQFSVRLEQKLPVARRRIESGERLTIDDLKLTWIELQRPDHRWVSGIDAVAGKTARTTLRQGQPLPEDALTGERVIEAGDPVKMIYRQGSVEVVVGAEAREHGALGESIGIYSGETRRRYRAVVRDPQTVIWEATQ